MSQLLGRELTQELFDRLHGGDIDSKTGKAIVIVTVDDNGWAHPAMLSYYEAVAKDRSRIDLAIGRSSTTAKNLKRTGKATLLITDRDINYYLKGKAHEIRESLAGAPFMSLFRVAIDQLLEDQEPGARITSGVTFHRPEEEKTNELVAKIFQAVRAEP